MCTFSPTNFDPIPVKFQNVPSVLLNDIFQLHIFGKISISLKCAAKCNNINELGILKKLYHIHVAIH